MFADLFWFWFWFCFVFSVISAFFTFIYEKQNSKFNIQKTFLHFRKQEGGWAERGNREGKGNPCRNLYCLSLPSKIDGLVGDYLSLQQAANKIPDCSYSLAGPNFYNFGYGFAFPKGSPWTEEATLSVLKNQENGSIQAILDYWFNKKECNQPVKELSAEKFIGLFLLLVGVIAFSIMALISEMLIIFLLVKFGRRLGPIGKFMKRMIFSVRKGEENEIHIKWIQLYRHHKSMRPSEAEFAAAQDTSFRRASFCNLSFEFGSEMLTRDEHSLYLRRCQLMDVDGENNEIQTAELPGPKNIASNRTENVSL